MTATIPAGKVRYTEEKATFLEGQAQRWLEEHHEAQRCQEHEILVRDINLLWEDILRLDHEIQTLYCNGMPFSEDLDRRINVLLNRWYNLGQKVDSIAKQFETKGYEVDGIKDLRHNVRQADSIINPSDKFSGWIEQLADKALQAHDEDDLVEGLID